MTAVEFLQSQAERLKYLSPEIFELAKEIEKQEIMDAVAHGNTYTAYCDNIDEHAESYYKHFFLTNKTK